MEKSACFSDCGTYRYILRRRWKKDSGIVNWIMLNPSTADHEQDDPTIRRCINFAKAWGYGGIVVTNLFAFRTKNPWSMLDAPDSIGPDNDHFLGLESALANIRVAAWGINGTKKGRAEAVIPIISHGGTLPIHWIGNTRTSNGQPGHPLYIPKDSQPQLWSPSK
jgi:hypothetical protein